MNQRPGQINMKMLHEMAYMAPTFLGPY